MTYIYNSDGVIIKEQAGALWMVVPTYVDMSDRKNESLGLEQPGDEEGEHELNLSAVTICEMCGYNDPYDYGGSVTYISYAVDVAREVHHIKLDASKDAICAALEAAYDHMALIDA